MSNHDQAMPVAQDKTQHTITGEEQEPRQGVLAGHSGDQEPALRPATSAMMHLAEAGTASKLLLHRVTNSLPLLANKKKKSRK